MRPLVSMWSAVPPLPSKSVTILIPMVYMPERYGTNGKSDQEVNPFICPKCQGTMSAVAIIEDAQEIEKIIEWAMKQDSYVVTTACARAPLELALLSV